jgi:hypothetical protein
MKKIILTITVFSLSFSCVSLKKYTEKEKENIRKIDSISNDFKNDLILDFNEDF